MSASRRLLLAAFVALSLAVLALSAVPSAPTFPFRIGAGIADITGPAAEGARPYGARCGFAARSLPRPLYMYFLMLAKKSKLLIVLLKGWKFCL